MVKQKIGAWFSLLLVLTLLIPTGRYFEAKAEERIVFAGNIVEREWCEYECFAV